MIVEIMVLVGLVFSLDIASKAKAGEWELIGRNMTALGVLMIVVSVIVSI